SSSRAFRRSSRCISGFWRIRSSTQRSFTRIGCQSSARRPLRIRHSRNAFGYPVRPDRRFARRKQWRAVQNSSNEVLDIWIVQIRVGRVVLFAAGIDESPAVQRRQVDRAIGPSDSKLVALDTAVPADVQNAAYTVLVFDKRSGGVLDLPTMHDSRA